MTEQNLSNSKQKLVIISGGNSYKSEEDFNANLLQKDVQFRGVDEGWKKGFISELAEYYQVLVPLMPSSDNAQYQQWAIIMNKIVNTVNIDSVYVGHSLGGQFLAQYFNSGEVKVDELHLIAAPFDSVGSFKTTGSFETLKKNCKKIHLWYSQDDMVVDSQQLKKYRDCIPFANVHYFQNKGHFTQNFFPELLAQLISDKVSHNKHNLF